jgi:hypothetical protein
LGVLSYQKNNKANEYSSNQSTQQSGGSLYVGVTDAASDISNVNNVQMSVKKFEVYSRTGGWMTVSSSEKKYALLSLKASGKAELYAKKENMEAGTYDKVRVTLGDTFVQTKTKGDLKTTEPSSQVVMNTMLKINENQNTNFKLDFMADKSLHLTSDGKYVFTPVVKAESTSNATVDVMSDDTVNSSGGTLDSSVNVGVDLDGSSKSDFMLTTDNSLKIQSNVGSQINFMLGGKSYMSDGLKTQEDEMTSSSIKSNVQTDVPPGSGQGSTPPGNDGYMLNGKVKVY